MRRSLSAIAQPLLRVAQIRSLSSTPATPKPPRILVTGAAGQIGTELCGLLRAKYGVSNVIATDISRPNEVLGKSGPYFYADVTDRSNLERLVVDHDISWVVHNSGILSAKGEMAPQLAFNVNILGFYNIMETAKSHGLRVFAPSSIAAFGPSTPRVNTPDLTFMRPTTIYGVSKVYVELLGEWYYNKYGVDFRSMRYPGIISALTKPGGGTTDYAVDIFYQTILTGKYECFLKPDSRLPMMYMPDCLRATMMLIAAPNEKLTQRTYNVTAMSFTPAEIAAEIQRAGYPLQITYKPDFRQKIADSWPESLDDSKARQDWGWKEEFDLPKLTADMLAQLSQTLKP